MTHLPLLVLGEDERARDVRSVPGESKLQLRHALILVHCKKVTRWRLSRKVCNFRNQTKQEQQKSISQLKFVRNRGNFVRRTFQQRLQNRHINVLGRIGVSAVEVEHGDVVAPLEALLHPHQLLQAQVKM